MPQHSADDPDAGLLYQVDENPPNQVTLGLGVQAALLSLGGIVLMPTIAFQAAGASESVVAWAIFASLIITGVVSGLQAFPVRRFGAGFVLVTGPVSAAIVVTVDALAAGGLPLLMTLTIATALIQFAFSYRIPILRRIITQTVSGIMLMLIPVTVAPIMFQRIGEISPGNSEPSGFACAFVTMATIVLVSLHGGSRLRPWSPLVGICAGGAAAGAFGLIDLDRIMQAAWVGFPSTAWPTVAIDLGPSFWGLLPSFLMVSVLCSIRTMGSALAIQDVSWRVPRAPDLRCVQGAVAADALANLLAGLSGAMVNSTRSSTVPLIRNTLVSARPVGLVLGFALVAFAFLPKFAALVLALPPSVLGAYLVIMVVTLFVTGLKLVVSAGLDYRRTLIAGISFWVGAGCEYGLLLPDILPQVAHGFFDNGLSTGGVTAILMTVLLELVGRRRRKLVTDLNVSCLPELREFIAQFGGYSGWSKRMLGRLDAVAEETLLTLLEGQSDSDAANRRLWVSVYSESGDAVLEFVAKSNEGNIEDRIAFLGDPSDERPAERDISLHLLRHLASEVRHRQYHDMDLIIVRVERTKGTARP